MVNEQFQRLYEEYTNMVYNLCLSYLHNAEDAEEATQDIFLKVHDKLDGFNQQSSLKTWIYRIGINHCLDRIKAAGRKKRLHQFLSLFDNSQHNTVKEFNHPGVQLEQKEATQQIFEAIDKLPANQKTAIILKSIDGLPMKEIAVILDVSEKAVESLLSRSRTQLKKTLNSTKD